MTSPVKTVSGSIEFIWDSVGDDRMLLNIDPDLMGAPHTFEVAGELRERLAGTLSEGQRVEIEFVPIEHEIVDPDSGPSDSHRPEVCDVRVLG